MYYPLAAPVRLLDTRGNGISPNACTVNNNQPLTGGVYGGNPTILQQGRGTCTIPTNAVAITGNLIPVPIDPGWGFLTLWPSDAAQPTIATTNYGTNEIINNVFTVGIGTDHKFKIYSYLTTHVVIDVTGYYALPPTPPAHGGLYFHPLPKPVRLLETRATQAGCHNTSAQLPSGILGNTSLTQQAWGSCDGATIPNAARAIVGNATSINPNSVGWLTLWSANEPKPLYVANANYNGGADEVVNTPFTTGLSPVGEFKIFTPATTHLTIDVLGYYSPEANDVNGQGLLFNPLAHPVRLLETRPGLPAGCFKPGIEYVGGQEYTQSAHGTCDGLNVPNDAMAITGNATVVFPGPSGGQSKGALTLWRKGLTRPASPDRTASNYLQGTILNRYFTVALGATDGEFRIHSTANTHLVIDVVGFFAPPPPPAPTVILTRAPVSVPAGGTTKIKATWSVTSGTVHGLDWIGLYPVGAANPDIGGTDRWQYTNGATSGSLEFMAPLQPGTYEFRYVLYNSNWTSVANSATINVFQPDYALERLDPINRVGEPGEDLLSGNYNWHLPLVSLPGRAGLDLNLGLTYNSRVWTKAANNNIGYIGFDADRGDPGPGFRLGFPTIESRVYYRYDTQPPTPFYLLTLPSGRRVELRNNMAGFGNSATNIYESVDSSRLRLKVHTLLPGQVEPEMTLYAPDGTKMFFQPKDWVIQATVMHRCTKITDRNGNYISVTYYVSADKGATGSIKTVTDTLGRVINFKYDDAHHLKKIYRCKNNIAIGQPGSCNDSNSAEVDYTWAMFEWNAILNVSNPNFQTGLNPTGTGSYLAFSRVILNDGTYYEFTYTTLGQLQQIDYKNPTNTKLLNRVFYTFLTGQQADCPRFTQRKDSAFNWMDAGDPAIRNYTFNQPANLAGCSNCISGQVVLPDDTAVNETYAMNGWQRGLLMKSAVGAEKKKTELTWTQDDVGLSYQRNPRVTQTKVSDDAGNCRKTTTDYTPVVATYPYPQPEYIKEYNKEANGGCNGSVYRTTKLSYTPIDNTYVQLHQNNTPDVWIIGLVSERSLYAGNLGTLRAKVKFFYDESGTQLVHQGPPINHESTANSSPLFDQSYLMRGNLTSVQRISVNDQGNEGSSVETELGYNTSGSVIFQRDPVGAQTDISYADDFAVCQGCSIPSTPKLAYPTKVTDPDGRLASPQFFSSSKYNYSLGQITQTATPKRPQDAAAATTSYLYDSIGRLQQATTNVPQPTGTPIPAYTRYGYDPDNLGRASFSTIEQGQGEFFSAEHLDGHGRVWAVERDHPGSTGGLSLRYTFYDSMGRAVEQSNPTEVAAVSGIWPPAGEFANEGFIYTTQTYDWQGRPLVTRNQDTTTRQLSYSGCGCAGGQMVTAIDEVGRNSDVSYDLFGRPWRERSYNAGGSNGTNVYATTTKSYNLRDQVTSLKQYQGTEATDGSCPSATCQEAWTTYDGHGRANQQKRPVESGPSTLVYNNNDTIYSLTDARGVVATYDYNNHRRLVTGITYTIPANSSAAPTSNVTFDYDELGNRKWMIETATENYAGGRVDYVYNSLSQLQAETRHFNTPNRDYTISYGYNLAGQLSSLTSPFNHTVSFNHDKGGRLSGVSDTTSAGATTTYASQIKYRAWDAINSLNYGNGLTQTRTHNARQQITGFTISGRNSKYGAPDVMKAVYQYHPDGRPKFAEDQLDAKFTRGWDYDHAGRLKTSYTGSEATSWLNNQPPSGTPTGPYKQTFTYNAWNELTAGDARFWSKTDTLTAQFTDARRQGWTYDDAGNIATDGQSVYAYDAAGRNTRVTGSNLSRAIQLHDGDGNVIKRIESDSTGPKPWHRVYLTSHYLRSTALGGQVLAKLDQNGDPGSEDFGIGGAEEVRRYSNGTAQWIHQKPLTGSKGESQSTTTYFSEEEPNSDGVNVGFSEPVAFPPDYDLDVPSYTGGGAGGNPLAPQCYIDGIPDDGCRQALRLVSLGFASVDPHRSDRWSLGRLGLRPVYGLAQGKDLKPGDPRLRPDTGTVPSEETIVIHSGSENNHWEFRGYETIGVGFGLTGGQGGGQQGGGGGASNSFHPCPGVSPSDLNFSASRGKKRPEDPSTNAIGHIYYRHLSTVLNLGASKFVFDGPQSLGEKIVETIARAQRVFQYGAHQAIYTKQGQVSGHIFVAAFPLWRNPLAKIHYGSIGIDSDHGFDLTNVATLILKANCKDVVTFHPGKPRNPQFPQVGAITGIHNPGAGFIYENSSPAWWKPGNHGH